MTSPDIADRHARVLIVDDDLHNRQVLEVMLAPEGYRLQTAVSGEEALAMVAAQAPDLILLDVMMPGMDGYAVAGTIKGNVATRNIPIIMITALGDGTARMLGLSAGAEDFLTKPVDRAELCVRVRNQLRLKAYSDDAQRYSQMLEGEVASRTADLRTERDRAQRYLDTAGVILLALDLDGRITLVNRHACSVLGWTSDELLGHDWIETCLPTQIRDAVRARFHDLLGGDLSVVETPVVTKTGEERLIEWRNTLLRDDTGQCTGVFSSGTDISERHEAIEARLATEARTRFALESAHVGIGDLDCRTGIFVMSETMEAHYGLQPGTFEGTFEAFVEFVHPDDRASVRLTVEEAMRRGTAFSIEHRSLWRDGTVRWLTSTGRFFLGEDGQPLRGVGISLDVTERRMLEQQYQQAQRMEAIGQLASGVAHDFNNLLTVILGFSDIMAADVAMADQQRKDLEEIMKAARRASRLTAQLLAFSRRQVLKTGAVDVNGLINDMTGMLGRLIGEHIEVSLVLAPDLPPVLADRGQLEQVVMNLVVNARDAMPDGGRVTIETTDVELENSIFHGETIAAGRYVMLAVTDNGSGMSKETQLRLFEPFFTTKKTGQGTGLGLSTVYGIIKQSNGHIWVDSEPGRGTTFKVYLPHSERQAPLPDPPSVVAAPERRASETVLLVEDEAGVRQLAQRILNDAGYRVLEAANGDAAEALFAGHRGPIHLIVSDVVMPGCGGPELMARLHVHAPAVRVLYMSGYTEQSTAHNAGIDRGLPFIQKPFTAAELVRQVREALDAPVHSR